MRYLGITGLAIFGLAAFGSTANAGYRIQFIGNQALATESANVPRAAGYVGVPAAPGNLSAPCSDCVPGGSAAPFYGAGTANQIVTFLHPYTNQAVTIPLTLPVGRPTVVTRSDRIIYNYGFLSQRVVVKFLPDGKIEVRYPN